MATARNLLGEQPEERLRVWSTMARTLCATR